MRKLVLIVYCCFLLIDTKSQTLTLTNVSQDVFCSKGKDTLYYSLSANNVPPNTNVVMYQSTDSLFNPYLGQGDSIGFIPGQSIAKDSITFGSCLEIKGIFIDACGAAGTEGQNEYLIMTSGTTGFLVNDLAIDYSTQNNGGNNNHDININATPCGYKIPDAALIANLRQGSCNASNVIPVGPGGAVPANAIVVLFTSDQVNTAYSLNGLCNTGYPVYVLQSNCLRTIGAFTNAPRCDAPLRYRTTSAIDNGNQCSDDFTYDLCGIYNLDGTYAIKQPGTDTASVTNNGIRRNTVDSCGGIDYSQLFFSKDTILNYPLNNPNVTCNSGYHYIKAITNPAGTNPISNTIKFKLICLNLSVTVQNSSICSGENAIIDNSTLDPNATFTWTVLPGPAISGASAGSGVQVNQTLTNSSSNPDSVIYYITVRDDVCNITQAVTVRVFPPPAPFSLGPDTSVCGPFSKTLSTGNPATIWSTGVTAASITVTTPGTYWAKKPASCGEVSDTIVISVNGTTPINLGNDTSYCGAFSRTLSTGDPTTVWSTGATASSILVSTPGTYWARIATPCGNVTDTIVLSQSNTATPFSLGNDTTYCGTFSRTLSTGDPSTVWSTGATASSISVSTPGMYWAKITGSCGTASDTIVLSQSPPLSVTISGNTSICQGNATTLTVTGGPFDSVRWSTNTTGNSISTTVAGQYSVTAYKGGCSGSDTVQVTVGSLTVNITGNLVICSGRPTTLDAGPGYSSYTWSNGPSSQTISTATPGQYIVDVTQGTCGASDTVVLIADTDPVVNITGATEFCFGASSTLDAGPGFTSYSWSTGPVTQTIDVTQTGQYIVTVTNANCSANDTIDVTEFDQILFQLKVDSVTCKSPGKITVINLQNGFPPFSYQLNSGTPQVTDSFPGVVAGPYTVTVTDSKNCNSTVAATLFDPTPVVLELGSDVTIQLGQTYSIPGTISNAQNPVTYNWTPSNDLSCTNCVNPVAGPDSTTLYFLQVTDNRGCNADDSITIIVFELIDIYMPTAFTPNDDNSNDVLYILGNPNKATIEQFAIFDRWGEKVFEADNFPPNDPQFGWDGTYKGAKALVDSYVFYIAAVTKYGERKEYKGTITLLR